MTGEGRRSGKVEKSLRVSYKLSGAAATEMYNCQLPWKLKQNSGFGERRALFSHAQSNGNWFRFSIRLHSASAQTSEQGKHLFRVLVR